MLHFLTRVELLEPYGVKLTGRDYDELHAAMQRSGFSRTIVASDGTEHHLPTAEYSLLSDRLTTDQVATKARNAANSTGKSNRVITVQGDASWYNLAPVQKTAAMRR